MCGMNLNKEEKAVDKNERLEISIGVKNAENETIREAGIYLLPSAIEPGKHQPRIEVKNNKTGFSIQTTLKPVDASSLERIVSHLEEKLKSPDVAEQAEKFLNRLTFIMSFLR